MVESGLIRRLRKKQEAEAETALVDAVADLLPDLILDALKDPRVRAAIINITRPAAKPPTRTTTKGVRRG